MIRFVKGTLAAAKETEVVIENQGIGFAVNVPASVTEHLPEIGEPMQLFTYFSVREDAMQLFGFSSEAELELFRLLLGVSGIGPKAGLAIIGAIGAKDVVRAILTDEVKILAKAPGIGAKTAKKVIIELKDKIEKAMDVEAFISEGEIKSAEGAFGAEERVIKDAIEALVVLGYQKTEAKNAVYAVEMTEEMTVEDLLKQSLRHL